MPGRLEHGRHISEKFPTTRTLGGNIAQAVIPVSDSVRKGFMGRSTDGNDVHTDQFVPGFPCCHRQVAQERQIHGAVATLKLSVDEEQCIGRPTEAAAFDLLGLSCRMRNWASHGQDFKTCHIHREAGRKSAREEPRLRYRWLDTGMLS